MKRLTTVILILALLTALFCAAAVTASAAKSCSHNWQLSATRKKPTCTEAGYGLYRCTKCGDTKTDKIKALGHNWGSWQTVKAPTCGKEGSQSSTCSRCGKVKTSSIPPTYKHKYQWVTVKKPTCSEKGIRQQVCSVCKLTHNKEAIPPTGKHTPKWVTTKKATCAEEGKRKQVCTVCKQTLKTEAIPPTGKHKLKWVVTKKATCSEEGTRERICTVCNKSFKKISIPATGEHKFGKWFVTIEAECEKGGIKSRLCKVCGLPEVEHIPAKGHDWDEGVITEEPTALFAGEITYTCKNDPSHTKTETLPVKKTIMRLITPVDCDPLVITKQPVGGTISSKKGGSVTLSVEVEGGVPPYIYTWRREVPWMDYAGTPDEMPILSIGSSTFTVTEGGVSCYCEIADQTGSRIRSDTVSVDSAFVIVEQPKDALYTLTDPVTLYCRAAGGVPFEGGTYLYAWYSKKNGQLNLSDNGYIDVWEVGEYYCVIEDAGSGRLTSDTVKVSGRMPFHTTGSSGTVYLAEGEYATIYGSFAGGVKPYSAAWYREGDAESFSVPSIAGDTFELTVTGTGEEMTFHLYGQDDDEGTAEAVIHVLPQTLFIEQQPQDGMLSPENVFGLDVKVSGGEAPYTFTLYHNGNVRYVSTQESESFSMPVFQAGQYCFEISDKTGATVRSQYALVREWKFTLNVFCVTGELPPDGGQATIVAVAEGGTEPVTYQWWYLGDAKSSSPAGELPESGAVITVTAPGVYQCKASDSNYNYDTASVEVKMGSKAPVITQHPQSITIPFEEGKTSYSAQLTCSAQAYDGAENVLEYTWECDYGSGAWAFSQSGAVLNLEKLTGGGHFRCVVTDTRNGEQTPSQTAVVAVSMGCEYYWRCGLTHSVLKCQIRGGLGPYTIRVYWRKILAENTDGTLQTSDILVREVSKQQRLNYIEIPDIGPNYEYPGWEGSKAVTKTAAPEFFVEVWDSTGQSWYPAGENN